MAKRRKIYKRSKSVSRDALDIKVPVPKPIKGSEYQRFGRNSPYRAKSLVEKLFQNQKAGNTLIYLDETQFSLELVEMAGSDILAYDDEKQILNINTMKSDAEIIDAITEKLPEIFEQAIGHTVRINYKEKTVAGNFASKKPKDFIAPALPKKKENILEIKEDNSLDLREMVSKMGEELDAEVAAVAGPTFFVKKEPKKDIDVIPRLGTNDPKRMQQIVNGLWETEEGERCLTWLNMTVLTFEFDNKDSVDGIEIDYQNGIIYLDSIEGKGFFIREIPKKLKKASQIYNDTDHGTDLDFFPCKLRKKVDGDFQDTREKALDKKFITLYSKDQARADKILELYQTQDRNLDMLKKLKKIDASIVFHKHIKDPICNYDIKNSILYFREQSDDIRLAINLSERLKWIKENQSHIFPSDTTLIENKEDMDVVPRLGVKNPERMQNIINLAYSIDQETAENFNIINQYALTVDFVMYEIAEPPLAYDHEEGHIKLDQDCHNKVLAEELEFFIQEMVELIEYPMDNPMAHQELQKLHLETTDKKVSGKFEYKP